jgi:hypothetical protein
MARGPFAALLVVASLCVLATVTYRMDDPDLWQHLTVGREIWLTHAVPRTQIWTWPTHGAPDVLPSWLFRALLWPFWAAGGVHGLFVWRWLTTLAAFSLLFMAARRAGATGVLPVLALVWCALVWRGRTQVRPETLVAILLAAELWLLEMRRAALDSGRGSQHAWGLVPIALVWANTHVSYFLGFVISGGYLLDDLRNPRARRPVGLALAIMAAATASFVNPFGWRALAQPFEYFFVWRHEPIYRTIDELRPVVWSQNLANGLPAFLLLLIVGALVRLWRRGPDWAELVLLAICLPQALTSLRFVGFLAVCMAPFFARDVGELAAQARWPAGLRSPARRAAVAALACVVIIVPEAVVGLGYGFAWNQYPQRSCDWIEQHSVRGRAFNPFYYGGYLLWRFYPDSTRLPFMDIHQAGTPGIRYEYAFAWQDSLAWRALDRRWRFDWAIMMRANNTQPEILDFLDADSTWALVFEDDAAALYLRRDGRDSTQAHDWGFRLLPGGNRRMGPLGDLTWRDSTARRELDEEIARAIRSSEWNGRAHALAANIAIEEGRWKDAAIHLRRAIALKAGEEFVHGRLGYALRMGGDPGTALAEFETEHRANPKWEDYDLSRALALQALGRLDAARAAYQRALKQPATSGEARDSLAALRVR